MTETRYAQVARDLAEGIRSGRFPVGSLLRPSSSCASTTRRAATRCVPLEELQELGLVSRRKKAGTRVGGGSATSGYRQSLASVEDLVQFGAAHVRVVREIQMSWPTGHWPRSLGCAPGSRWLRISSLRMNGEPNAAPIGWTDVYVDAATPSCETWSANARSADQLSHRVTFRTAYRGDPPGDPGGSSAREAG